MKTFGHCCFIIACIFFLAAAGCGSSNSATGGIAHSGYAASIERAKKDKLYMILHSGINIYSIASVQTDKAKQQLTVQLDKVDSSHMLPKIIAGTSEKGQSVPPATMHLYMTDSTSYTLDEPHTIMLSKVARVERVE